VRASYEGAGHATRVQEKLCAEEEEEEENHKASRFREGPYRGRVGDEKARYRGRIVARKNPRTTQNEGHQQHEENKQTKMRHF